jgi:hypothetical protein
MQGKRPGTDTKTKHKAVDFFQRPRPLRSYYARMNKALVPVRGCPLYRHKFVIVSLLKRLCNDVTAASIVKNAVRRFQKRNHYLDPDVPQFKNPLGLLENPTQ